MERSSSNASKKESDEYIIGGKYKALQKIGSGLFGDVYRGVAISDPDEEVAIKIERMNSSHILLEREAKVYKRLEGAQGSEIPQFKWYGQDRQYDIMVTSLLGPSLEQLLEFCGGKFSVKTVIMLADQMLERVAYLHGMGYYVHRDIKAANFLMGVGSQCDKVYIIDFRLAKQFPDFQTMDHLPLEAATSLVGTLEFLSINAHQKLEKTQRDDLEALAYVFIYFLKGSLPWQCIREDNKATKYNKVKESKMSISVCELCSGIPSGFGKFLAYYRRLKQDQDPNYDALRLKFREVFKKLGMKDDGKYDWTILKESGDLMHLMHQ